MEIDSRAVIMHLVPRYSNIRDDQPVGVHHGPATFPPRASDQENSVEPVVVNFAVGDAAGVDGEFRIAVIQLNARAFIVVYEQGIEGALIRIFDVNAVSGSIADAHVGNVQVRRRRAFQVHGDGPDSRSIAVGKGVCSAD